MSVAKDYSANVDTPLIEKFLQLPTDNVSQVAHFISIPSSNLTKVLSNWSYFLTINDHAQFIRVSNKLVELTVAINKVIKSSDLQGDELTSQLSILDARPIITDFYQSWLTEHTKLIYRCLNNRPNLSIPVMRLLTNLIEFGNPSLINELINGFDFNSSFVAKLPIHTNKSVRSNFISFWFALNSHVNSFIRRDLLLNNKIMNNIWKNLETDSLESLTLITSFISQYICHDANFKKSTKCKILNENFLFKFSALLVKLDQPLFEPLKPQYLELLNLLTTDTNHGLKFPINNNGIPLVINNHSFKLNNKMIYTLLTFLKPWEVHSHLLFVITILESNRELIGPYSNWIVSNGGGYHDPSLTSWWIGHTLLYTRILSIPQLSQADMISLAPLSKSSLTKCLESGKKLVIQLTLQLILLQLKQLAFCDSASIEIVIANLPSAQQIHALINHDNKFIRLTVSMILAKLDNSVKTTNLSLPIQNLDYSSKFDLLLLDNYLSIQSNELKWFNKANETSNSFFVTLLKLGKSQLQSKIIHILSRITTNDTAGLIFNPNLIESPLISLVQLGIPNDDVAKLVDETIARAVKFPYKYLDASHFEYQDLSLFVVVLFEQTKFIDLTSAETKKWLNQLCGRLVLIGEPQQVLLKLNPETEVITENHAGIPINKFQFASLLFKFNQLNDERQLIDVFTQLGNYIISDSSIHSYITTAKFWSRYFDDISQDKPKPVNHVIRYLINELFQQLSIFTTANEFQTFIFQLLKQQTKSIPVDFCWCLSNDQLVELTSHNTINPHIYQQILERKLTFVPNVANILDKPGFEAILLHYPIPLDLIKHDLHKYRYLLPQCSNKEDLLQVNTDGDELLIYELASISSQYCHDHRDEVAKLALSLQDWEKSLTIFEHSFDIFDSSNLCDVIFNKLDNGFLRKSFTPSFVPVLARLQANLSDDRINDWVHKVMLYITKKFSESEQLSNNFDLFLKAVDEQVSLQKVPLSIVNAQLEVILSSRKWIVKEVYLNHTASLINSKSIHFEKLLNIFINNENNVLFQNPTEETKNVRHQSAVIIEKLFFLNPAKTSTEILLDNILAFYLGSTRSEDLIIKKILVTIENSINKTWATKISNWDLASNLNATDLELVSQERLFIKDKSSFVVSISKNFIDNTIQNLEPTESQMSYDYNDTIYDAEFLLMLIINNDELINEVESKEEGGMTQVSIDLKKLVDSSLLQFIIVNLSHSNQEIVKIARILINGIIKSLSSQDFKDRHIFEVYLCNILNTMRNEKFAHSNSLIWYGYSSLAPILANPGHFLYEKVFRYVLSTPTINEVPLYRAIATPFADEEESSHQDLYYRQLNWLIENLIHGTKKSDDLDILRSKKIIEWLMNLYQSLYTPFKTRQVVLKYIFVLQNIGNLGSDLLVTRFAALSNFEIVKSSLQADNLIDDQLSLNIDEIMLRFGLTFQNNKRIREWTSGDVVNVVKRVHTESLTK